MAAPLATRFKDGRYCLSYYLDGRRVRETFAHSKDAQGRAREIERLKGKGLKIASKEEVAVDEAAQYATSALLAKPSFPLKVAFSSSEDGRGETGETPLSSVGGGVRYAISTYLSLRFDYGFQLLHTGEDNDHGSRSDLGIIVSY